MKLHFVRKIFTESNVHGFPLVMKSKHHLLERLLWLALVVTSTYFASDICNNEWQRYQNNSMVVSLETNHRSWKYLVPAFTICTTIVDQERMDNLIVKTWGISRNSSKLHVYKKFIEVVTLTTYENLKQYRQFLKYSFLDRFNMLEIAKEMREYLMPQSGFNLVTTEVGVCFSSTNLFLLQNATERTISIQSDNGDDYCRSALSLESCYLTVSPLIITEDDTDYKETMFIHNKDDVLNPSKSIKLPFLHRTITKIELLINAIVSSSKLQQLTPAQRKCSFESELSLKYFDIYKPNLCLISCRIDAAVKLCGCIPFFYGIKSNDHPVCNIQGLNCLSNEWFDKVSDSARFDAQLKCECPALCDNYEYRRGTVQSHTYTMFGSAMEVLIKFPKSRLKRGVLYSADNLLVAFGGVFALCLGCSLISFVEFLYFLFETLIAKIAKVCEKN